MNSFAAALFDLDGTLADSEILKAQALSMTVFQLGGSAPLEVYREVMGSDWSTVRSHFCRQGGLATTPANFDTVFRALYTSLIRTRVTIRPWGREYLAHLRREGRSIGLVSSAARWMVDGILARTGLQDAFQVIVGGDDVTRHKPDPEAYLLALSRLAVKPTDAIVFEDSASGVLAGWRAGCRVVAIRHEFNLGHDLSLASATIASFEELLAEKKTFSEAQGQNMKSTATVVL